MGSPLGPPRLPALLTVVYLPSWPSEGKVSWWALLTLRTSSASSGLSSSPPKSSFTSFFLLFRSFCTAGGNEVGFGGQGHLLDPSQVGFPPHTSPENPPMGQEHPHQEHPQDPGTPQQSFGGLSVLGDSPAGPRGEPSHPAVPPTAPNPPMGQEHPHHEHPQDSRTPPGPLSEALRGSPTSGDPCPDPLLPSLDIPTWKHFWRRQNWHRFRVTLSIWQFRSR